MREANNRIGILNTQQGNIKKTMIGVLLGNLTKKDFETILRGDITETEMERPQSDRDAANSSLLYYPMAWSPLEITLVLEKICSYW